MMDSKAAVFMGIGFELVALTLGAAFIGDKIDKHFNWPGYATITLIILFFVSWFYHLLILLRRIENNENKH